ncbi:hypothetical protein DYB32_009503 [Aphanomyces invadans]|uniref:Tc1-like transposase DDE domain-containing protein n=1 Tax=Aphanomyces invadans TaxID=157072 RepID=A0A3R6YSE0_9STRA|nr:hypothetical protein DYB32_009503 [Aphanomyces invadans]
MVYKKPVYIPFRLGMILDVVRGQHASRNTVMHALYAHYYLGMKRQEVAKLFHKSMSTVSAWIQRYEASGDYSRTTSKRITKFTPAQRKWLLEYFQKNPMTFLDEAKKAFEMEFRRYISLSSVWKVIHSYGLTWKVLERRAMHIKQHDVQRFFEELASLNWSHWNIQFLDEVSFDSRGMLRKRGYALKGQKLCFRGEFQRKPRVSLLCFADVTGVVEVFDTVGTFDRARFVDCCVRYLSSVCPYPGRGSIWILDGASIHCHPDIVNILRGHGVVPVFLPAYCAFYNPIEYMFGLMKNAFKRNYKESQTKDLMVFIMSIIESFKSFDLSRIFNHCGYTKQGRFDPSKRLAV